MISRLHISMFIGLALFAWVGLLWVRGVQLSWEYLWPYGLVVSILVLIATIFERRGWAWRFLHGWFVKRPDIRGSWRVELDSEWVDPRTEEGGRADHLLHGREANAHDIEHAHDDC